MMSEKRLDAIKSEKKVSPKNKKTFISVSEHVSD